MDKNYDVITFILKYLYFKKAYRVVNFVDIIKIATMYKKTTFKGSKKGKIIRNYILKYNLYLYFLIFFRRKKADVSRKQGVCHVIYIFFVFLDLLKVNYNLVKFQHCRICVTEFREGDIREHPRKGAS